MKQLIEDYERRIATVKELLTVGDTDPDTIKRLETKLACYRTFVTELTRELLNPTL